MSPRTGRPPKENPKNVKINIRLTEETAAILQKCSEEMNVPRAIVIEQGICLVRAKLDENK